MSLALFVCLLPVLACAGEPATAPQTVVLYAIWEHAVPNAPPATTQSRARIEALITTPGGKHVRLPAFVYRPYTRARDAQGHEVLRPAGQPQWMVRYAPDEAGQHGIRFLQRQSEGADRELGQTTLHATEAEKADPGFVRVGVKQPDRFVFDSGRGYFALGHNVCWVRREQGTFGFDDYFAKMAEAGENYTRLWLCTWGISLDTQKPYATDLADAWRLDHVLRVARERGIYVKLCIDNFYDFQNHYDLSPYSQANGGPCDTRGDFFMSAAARQQYQARLRYLVARYGAFTSLLAWELWNEMDYALHPVDLGTIDSKTSFVTYDHLRDKVLVPWTVDTAKALRRLDPYRHLVTTSLGLHAVWDEVWKQPEIDFVQYHSYIHYLDLLREPVEEDAAAFVLAGQAEVQGYKKPALLAEFGYMGEGETSSLNALDPDGIALHNALWSGTMSGAAGTPMLWWWDNYIDPQDLYYHYKSLSTFLKDVDWNQAFAPMRVEVPGLRVLALRGADQVLLWIQNRENTWYARIKQGRQPRTLGSVVLALRDFPAGVYQVQWFDPYRGTTLSSHSVDGTTGVVRLKPPAFRLDVAARLYRSKP